MCLFWLGSPADCAAGGRVPDRAGHTRPVGLSPSGFFHPHCFPGLHYHSKPSLQHYFNEASESWNDFFCVCSVLGGYFASLFLQSVFFFALVSSPHFPQLQVIWHLIPRSCVLRFANSLPLSTYLHTCSLQPPTSIVSTQKY